MKDEDKTKAQLIEELIRLRRQVAEMKAAEFDTSECEIAECKRTEEALHLNEEQDRTAQAISHVGNWEYNLQTNAPIFSVDRRYCYTSFNTIRTQIANIFLTIPDEDMYGEVLIVVLQALESRFGVFGFIDVNGDLIIPSMTREIWNACQVPDKSIIFPQSAWGDSLWGRAIREKRALYSDGPFRIPAGHIHVDHFLAVPIIFGSETIGLLSVANSKQSYTEEDKDLLESIAGYIAPILNARLQRDRYEQDRKRVESELQRSNDLLRAIIEAAPTAIIGLDLDGNVQTVWNPAAEKMLGWSAQEAIGHLLPSVPTESQEEFKRFREMIRKGLTLDGVEVRRQRRDGSPIDYSIYASPLRDAKSHVVGNVAVLVDITERRRSEEERKTHLWFLESLDQINRAIQGTNDTEQMMSAVLNAALEIFDCDRASLVYPCDPESSSWQVPMECTKPEYPGVHAFGKEQSTTPEIARTFRIIRDASGPVKFGPGTENSLLTDESQHFGFQTFMAMALYPKVDAPWEFVLHQCSYPKVWTQEEERLFQEIGWRLADALTSLLVYQELQRSEERLRLPMEAARIGVWDWNIQHDTWYASPTYYTMLGYEPKEGLGDRSEWLERVHPEERDAVYEKVQNVLAGTSLEYRYEARIRHADGAYRWMFIVGLKLQRNQKGRATRMMGIRMDITDRKHAEEEVRRLNQELEQRVHDRTAQLEAANKELEAFAYSVSHDLRAPLRHIDGFLELLRKRLAGTLDERSQHYMDTIADSSKRMGILIDDLLSFSRMGRHEMSKMKVDLSDLVQGIIQELSPEIEKRSVHWRIAALPTVTGDRAMLRLVLTNLISNALKFTRPRPRAEIEIGCQKGENAETIVFIRDNGVGFDMAYADKLFGVFQRLHRVDEFEGTGIGLATVRRIIHRHGGRVWAEGTVNRGATFYFALPQFLPGDIP